LVLDFVVMASRVSRTCDTYGSVVPESLVVGFDLDMTLVDSRPGIQATLDVLARESGEPALDDASLLDALLRRNLDLEFADRFPTDRAHELAERFRDLYITFGVPGTHVLAGAPEALRIVRDSGARTMVVTAKYEPNAHRCLDHVGLVVDAVFGWRYGPGKAETLREHGAYAYVGDTPRDMEAACAADALAVGVTTGPHDDAELRAAGAHVVLSSLVEFPAWWATGAPLPHRARSDRGG
jgi:phosphoglycolate phosphatase